MIEDILLYHSDQRNIHKLRKYLPYNFCEHAANAILEQSRKSAHHDRVLGRRNLRNRWPYRRDRACRCAG